MWHRRWHMINTFASACEYQAAQVDACTRRSKKPCLLINEIFLGRTLMIHLSRWSTGEQGTQRQNTEQGACRVSLKGTSRSGVPHAAIQTQRHSGVRNKQNENAIEIWKSHAHVHLFFWLWYGTVTSCCLKFNEMHLGIKMKWRKSKSQRKKGNYTGVALEHSCAFDIWWVLLWSRLRACINIYSMEASCVCLTGSDEAET